MVRRIFICLSIITISVSTLSAQVITPVGYFEDDSISIGLPFRYILSVKYPEQLDILFPDSTYDFAPFEFVRKEALPTYKDSTNLVDSAVYYLRTFEVDPSQGLALPVFLLKSGDSIRLEAPRDSAVLKEMIPVLSAHKGLQSSTKLEKVNKGFNYPYLIIGLLALAFIGLLVLVLFGKKIRKYFRIKQLRQQYIAFSDQFSASIAGLNTSQDLKTAEQSLIAWKKYLQQLEKKSYSTMTTKEIAAFDLGSSLINALKQIDRCLYKGRYDKDMIKGFETLEDVAQERYGLQLEKIKNA